MKQINAGADVQKMCRYYVLKIICKKIIKKLKNILDTLEDRCYLISMN